MLPSPASASTTVSRAAELEKALEDVRASRPAAVRVLHVADDPNADARRVGEAIEADPVLTAQLLRLANSAAFGMRSRVASTQHAVSVVGFSAVRSIATLVAAGLRNQKNPPPPGFWRHAAATAAACSVVAHRFDVPRGEAFAIGLLHDLGTAILFGVDPESHAAITNGLEDTPTVCIAEAVEFGMSHADAAARVLAQWNFPEDMVEAVAGHHDGIGAMPQARVVIAGDALAHLVLEPATEDSDAPERLGSLGLSGDALEQAARLTQAHATEVLAALPAS